MMTQATKTTNRVYLSWALEAMPWSANHTVAAGVTEEDVGQYAEPLPVLCGARAPEPYDVRATAGRRSKGRDCRMCERAVARR